MNIMLALGIWSACMLAVFGVIVVVMVTDTPQNKGE